MLLLLCDSMLQVSRTSGMVVGQWVRINMDDPMDCSLARDMNGGIMGCGQGVRGTRQLIRHMSRITALGTNWIRWGRGVGGHIRVGEGCGRTNMGGGGGLWEDKYGWACGGGDAVDVKKGGR